MCEDEEFYERSKEIRIGPPPRYIPNHLSSAIHNDEGPFLLDNDIESFFGCVRHTRWKQLFLEKGVKRTLPQIPNFYGKITNWIRSRYHQRGYEYEVDHLLEVTSRAAKISQGLLDKVYDTTIADENLSVHELIRDRGFKSLCLDMYAAEHLKDQICQEQLELDRWIVKEDIIIDPDLALILLEGEWIAGHTPMIIAVADIMQSWPQVYLYWHVADKGGKYSGQSLINRGMILKREIENLRATMDSNKFFEVLSLIESLIVGSIVMNNEEDCGFSSLFLETKDKMVYLGVKETTIDVFVCKDIPTPLRYHVANELVGIQKMFGHPVLNVEQGFLDLATKGKKEVTIDGSFVKRGIAMFKFQFCQNYYLAHGVWPNIVNDTVPQSFKKYIMKNLWVPKWLLRRETYMSFVDIEFNQCLDFDFNTQTTDLLKDSSLAPERANWAGSYDPCAFRILYGKKRPPFERTENRTVMHYLRSREEETTKRKILECDSGKDRYEKDGIAVTCRKNQELKVGGGRLFIKQTFDQRLLQTCTEQNISKKLFKYLPDQTMNNSELDVLKRSCAAVHDMEERVEITNTDFSKWNLAFRHSLCAPFGNVIDQLFGFQRLFKEYHRWFYHSLVISNSRLHPPDYDLNGFPIEGPYAYTHHQGGFEGMHQKFWTLITMCLIRVVAEDNNMNVEIMCQGDNQVIFTKYSDKNYHNRVVNRGLFLDSLRRNLGGVGLELKMSETWFSRRLFEYGKVRYYSGVAMSQATKKLARCFPDADMVIPSLLTGLENIGTITESAAKMDNRPVWAFTVHGWAISRYIRRKVYQKRFDVTHMVALLLWPSSLGGLAISSLINHCVRGIDDQLPYSISLMRYIHASHRDVFEVLNRWIDVTPIRDLNMANLFEDIFSLRLNTPPNPVMSLQRSVEKILPDFVENPDLTKILSTVRDKPVELITALATMKPLYPALCHEILSNSNYGVIRKLAQRFTNISTIVRVAVNIEGESILTRVSKDEMRLYSWFYHLFRRTSYSPISNLLSAEICDTQVARQLRDDHWGTELVGNTHPSPICQVSMHDADFFDKRFHTHSILVQTSDYLRTVQFDNIALFPLGKNPPYLGSGTVEKRTRLRLGGATNSPFFSALANLIKLYHWAKKIKGHNLSQALREMIQEKIDILSIPHSVEEILSLGGDITGGNIIHRLLSEGEARGAMINNSPTFSTHLKISTSGMWEYSKGKDFTIHFQSLFLFCQHIMIDTYLRGMLLPPETFCYIKCKKCTIEVTEIRIDISPLSIPAQKMIPINEPFQEKIIAKYHDQEVGSYLMGRKIGLHYDRVLQSRYDNIGIIVQGVVPNRIDNYGVTETRRCDLIQLFAGMVQGSRNLIKDALVGYYRGQVGNNRALSVLAEMIIQSGRQNEVCLLLGVKMSNHAEGTQSSWFSNTLLRGLNHYLKHNDKDVLHLFFKYKLDTDLQSTIIMRVLKYLQLIGKPTKYIPTTLIELRKKLELPRFRIITNTIDEGSLLIRQADFTEGTTLHVSSDNIRELRAGPHNRCGLAEICHTQGGPILGHLSSYINHASRTVGSISTAAAKLKELIGSISGDPDQIICLAEGSGSCLLLLYHMFPEARLYYNTLKGDFDPRDNPSDWYPPAIKSDVCYSKIIGKLSDSSGLVHGTTDITKSIFLTKLKNECDTSLKTLILCDAEFKEDLLAQDITKTMIFVSDLFPNSVTIQKHISLDYVPGDWQRFKPLCSNINNNELYAINCRNCFHYYGDQHSDTLISALLNVTDMAKYLRIMEVAGRKNLADSSSCLIYSDALGFPYNQICHILCRCREHETLESLDKMYHFEREGTHSLVQKRERGHWKTIILQLNRLIMIKIFRRGRKFGHEELVRMINRLYFVKLTLKENRPTLERTVVPDESIPEVCSIMKGLFRSLAVDEICHCGGGVVEARRRGFHRSLFEGIFGAVLSEIRV